MIFSRHVFSIAAGILFLIAGHETCSAQGYGLGTTSAQIQGAPGLSLSPLLPLGNVQPSLAPFSPQRPPVPAPVFEEPPSEIEAPAPESAVPSPSPTLPEAPGLAPNEIPPSTQLNFRLGGVVQAIYDSNIFIQENHAKSDAYFVLAPTIALGNGGFAQSLEAQQQTVLQPQYFINADLIRTPSQPFYYLLYIPSYTAFVDHTNLNSFDNDISGAVQVIARRLTLGAFARFQTLRIPDIDVGNRVTEQWTSARAYALYALSDRTQLTADLFLQDRETSGFISALEIWNEDWVDYGYSSKTSFGAGVAAGLVLPSAGPDEYYGRLQTRATWNATKKISVAAKAGFELRAVSSGGQRFYPVFGLEGRYAITTRTSAGISIYQQIQASAEERATVYITRGLSVNVGQRILDRYVLTVAAGYTNTDYDTSLAQTAAGPGRTDNFVFVSSGLRVALDRWVDTQVGVEFRKNHSSLAGSSFNEVLGSWALHLKF